MFNIKGSSLATCLLLFVASFTRATSAENIPLRRNISLTTIEPTLYAIGTSPILEGLPKYSNQLSLSPDNPLLTLDYGSEVVGTPVFSVSELSGPTQIELKYTEEFNGLNNIYGDGPWTFANDLSSTFRTETFNITELGSYQSYFLQGGQRWQLIELLTDTSTTFSQIGFTTNSPIISNDKFKRLCVDNDSLASTWEITTDGALIRGQEPASSTKGVDFSNYTMSFLTKIVRGGTGWRVASGLVSYGPYFVLTSRYPEESTFRNTNTSLLPANSIVVGYGWSLSTESYALNLTINENQWYEITTAITDVGFKILINGETVATISYEQGTWGFGPFQDQAAYFKDVKVYASNGTTIYENSMTSADTLVEYGVAQNSASACLDGPKRDRLVWIGDFVHTARTIAATTNRTDHIRGVIEFEFARQIESGTGYGLVPTEATMGRSSNTKAVQYPTAYGITDYEIFFMVTLGDYYRITGDIATLATYWNPIKVLTEAMLGYVDSTSGLISGAFFFTGPSNGTAPTSLMVIALQQLSEVAEALEDTTTASAYQKAATDIRTAVNRELWNDEISTYSLCLSSPTNFSATGIAFAIRAGIANETQAELSLAKLPLLKYGCGYVTDDTVVRSNETQLSPNMLGFLLESLFIANTTMGVQTLDVAKDLLDNFWSLMVSQNQYYTGATWEYLYPDGSPGIGLYISLSHPWGSAPSYILEEYVLGVEALEPGYKKWQFQPLLYGLDLNDVEGVVPTPFGDIIAAWSSDGDTVTLMIEAPVGTEGVINLPFATAKSVVHGKFKRAAECRNKFAVQGEEKIKMDITL